jgi:hypothetical protein
LIEFIFKSPFLFHKLIATIINHVFLILFSLLSLVLVEFLICLFGVHIKAIDFFITVALQIQGSDLCNEYRCTYNLFLTHPIQPHNIISLFRSGSARVAPRSCKGPTATPSAAGCTGFSSILSIDALLHPLARLITSRTGRRVQRNFFKFIIKLFQRIIIWVYKNEPQLKSRCKGFRSH